jgi:hypothetical protein
MATVSAWDRSMSHGPPFALIHSRIVSRPHFTVLSNSQVIIRFLHASDNGTRCAAYSFDFVHACPLYRGWLLPRLLDLKEQGSAVLDAEQVRNARQLVRTAMNLHHPPAQPFGVLGDRGNDGSLKWHGQRFCRPRLNHATSFRPRKHLFQT